MVAFSTHSQNCLSCLHLPLVRVVTDSFKHLCWPNKCLLLVMTGLPNPPKHTVWLSWWHISVQTFHVQHCHRMAGQEHYTPLPKNDDISRITHTSDILPSLCHYWCRDSGKKSVVGGSNTFIKYKRLFCSAVMIIQNILKINRIAVLRFQCVHQY